MDGLLLPVIVDGIRSLKDGSVSIVIVTNELTPSRAGEVFSLRGKICYAYFSANQFDKKDPMVKIVDSMDPDVKYKSPSQRLRDVMYRLWEQKPEGYKDSDSFYKYKMEHIISTYKSELQP